MEDNSNKRKIIATICCFVIASCVLFAVGITLMKKTISISSEQPISYDEKSQIDYKVYLKKNDFYEDKYLEKGQSYVANLIDYININFDYKFLIDRAVNANYKYKIIGVLEIYNQDSNNVFFTKSYDLSKEKEINFVEKDNYEINESIDIDYATYNQIANNFKASYGVNTDSSLKVYLKVENNIAVDDVIAEDYNLQSDMFITIPLSQKAISININYNDVNKKSTFLSSGTYEIIDYKFFGLGTVLIICGLCFLGIIAFILYKANGKLSEYEKTLKRILADYDRLIVNVSSKPSLDDVKVINVDSIEELIDARDNFHKPINFYEVRKGKKSFFFIRTKLDIYLYTLSSTKSDNK